MLDFVHLHVHTQYSLLDGLSKLDHLIEKVKDHGQQAVAITDHGAMYGVVHFYNTCIKADVKPIIGVEAYMSESSRFDKQVKPGADQYHLTLLAKSNQGYRNLMQLVSLSHLEGFSYKPRMDLEILSEYSSGIIATTGCSSSIISKKILQDKPKEAREWVQKLHNIYGDNLYVEIQSHPKYEEIEQLRGELVDLANKHGLPLLATNDVHYVDPEDAQAQDALLAVQLRKTIDDKDRLSIMDSPDFYLRSTTEMKELFANHPEAIKNSVKIAQECNVTIPTGKMIFPNYPLNKGDTTENALRRMTKERTKLRYQKVDDEITERIKYELDIICSKGYASYFLIVQDFVNWAKDNGIGVGPGRGSAAGSIVSYILGITDIDPIKHTLPFERFMNPQRPSPPDIDIDFADINRDEVIRYVASKYGEDHVAQVITFGTMEARAAIRDIGRVLGVAYSETDKIAKMIPVGKKLQAAIDEVPELKDMHEDPEYKQLLDLALKVEGSARHHSVHAAAVVIADKPLVNYTPIQRESKGGKVITQYDMYALDLNIADDAIGLLKMDFLGLRNLSILSLACEFVLKERDQKVDVSNIPLDDQKVYQMLSEGETTGVFQLESPGMRRVARSLKPERFSDITAMVALYRPGPMELIDDFIKGKHEPEKVVYPHPDLKPVLEETYGIPVYQEQVLQIANVFAGYSLGEADILRRAIGKKKLSILNKEKKRFVKGAVDKGYRAKKAEEIWGFIEKFAGYGFNKAHSASYGMIAYQTAYMKANYPTEYMAALLSIESQSHSNQKDEKVAQGIEECKRMNIQVLPPDINNSQVGFSIEELPGSLKGQAIRFGLSAVKNVGEAAIENIIEERSNGKFVSFTDFCYRVDNRKVNKKVVESLISTGAFDSFGKRAAMIQAAEEIRQKAGRKQADIESGQTSIFDTLEDTESKAQHQVDNLPDIEEFDTTVLLNKEKELLGVYVSDHPLSGILSGIDKDTYLNIEDLDPLRHNQKTVRLTGVITRLKQVVTKKTGAEMAFATFEDMTGSIEAVLFPQFYKKHKLSISLSQPVVVKGKFEVREGESSLLVDELTSVKPPEQLNIEGKDNQPTISIPKDVDAKTLAAIGKLLKNNPGKDKLRVITDSTTTTGFDWPQSINWSDNLEQEIGKLISQVNG